MQEVFQKADILGLGETSHGTHGEFFKQLKKLEPIARNQISGIFIELPIDFQISVDFFLKNNQFDRKLQNLILGAKKEGKSFEIMMKDIFNFAIDQKIPVLCADSSKIATEEYCRQHADSPYWYSKGKSRDEDMFTIIKQKIDTTGGKWLFIAGAGHIIKGKGYVGDLSAGEKLRLEYGSRYFPAGLVNVELLKETSLAKIICFNLLKNKQNPLFVSFLDYKVSDNKTFKPTAEMFDGFIFCATLQKLAEQIVLMAERDQKMRFDSQNPKIKAKFDTKIDKTNAKKLNEIIDEIGWPTISKVGEEASYAAWLIAQHADADTAFQEKCLNLMKKSKEGDVLKASIASLTDRVAVNNQKPQTYGTQFYRDEAGNIVPRPIEDFENIEKRRKSMDLEPFTTYEKRMEGEFKYLKNYKPIMIGRFYKAI